uniref:Uncharacterized protein n=1 Tax=Rhizophora mucronata TaxID=61149 RepID=A0A2P2N0M3_RHIMU
MYFTDGLAPPGGRAVPITTAAAAGLSHVLNGILSDHPNAALLSRRTHQYLVRSMNLVIRKYSIFEHEPPRPPSLTVIYPFVQNSGDTPAHAAVIHLRIPRFSARSFRNLIRVDI